MLGPMEVGEEEEGVGGIEVVEIEGEEIEEGEEGMGVVIRVIEGGQGDMVEIEGEIEVAIEEGTEVILRVVILREVEGEEIQEGNEVDMTSRSSSSCIFITFPHHHFLLYHRHLVFILK